MFNKTAEYAFFKSLICRGRKTPLNDIRRAFHIYFLNKTAAYSENTHENPVKTRDEYQKKKGAIALNKIIKTD